MMWRLKFLCCAIVELIALLALPFGGTAASFVVWLRAKAWSDEQ
jgi:hypothetical protein